VRQVRGCGLKFHTIVKCPGVTVTQHHGNVMLEGQWADIDAAVNYIKDAVANSLCGAFDTWNHTNGSAAVTSVVDESLDELDRGKTRDVLTDDRQTRDSVTVDTDHAAAHRHHNVVSHSFTESTSSEVTENQLEIDEHVWRYIAFKYPDMCEHWKQALKPRFNVSSKMLEMTGQPQDLVNLREWWNKHDLTSVVQRVVEIAPAIDMNALKTLISSSEGSKFGVYVRLIHSTHIDLIGKASDISDLISWLNVALRDVREHMVNGSTDFDDTARVNGPVTPEAAINNVSSHINSPVAAASPELDKKPIIMIADRDRLKFKTTESQLVVEVLTGDLTRQKTQVIVNPANKHLLHYGGAARAIQNAAGPLLINECKDYIRKSKELPTSSVMHTTSGNLPRPINHVIHACGPDARQYPDDSQCLQLLEQTFYNCFVCANDTLHARSLALPAISSGTSVVFLIVKCQCTL